MSHVDFFRKQSKNFLKDWKTQPKTVEDDGLVVYHYKWKFFDLDDLLPYFKLNNKEEQDIKLARAQHYIAKMVGYKKWNDLIQASEKEQELAELLLRHFKSSSDIEEWGVTLAVSGVEKYGIEAVLDYAKQYYHTDDSVKLARMANDKVRILQKEEKSIERRKILGEQKKLLYAQYSYLLRVLPQNHSIQKDKSY